MNIKPIVCPSCGATLQHTKSNTLVCDYCGKNLVLEDVDLYDEELEDALLRQKYDRNAFAANKNRALKIGASNMKPIQKLIALAYNREFKYNIVEMMVNHGIQIINLLRHYDEKDFGPEGVDEYGNTFFDFLDNDNNFAWIEMEKAIKDVKKDLHSLTKKELDFVQLTDFAIYLREANFDIWDKLAKFDDDKENVDARKLIDDLLAFVANNAYRGKTINAISDVNTYVNLQYKIIKTFALEYLEVYDYDFNEANWQNYRSIEFTVNGNEPIVNRYDEKQLDEKHKEIIEAIYIINNKYDELGMFELAKKKEIKEKLNLLKKQDNDCLIQKEILNHQLKIQTFTKELQDLNSLALIITELKTKHDNLPIKSFRERMDLKNEYREKQSLYQEQKKNLETMIAEHKTQIEKLEKKLSK